MAFLMAAIAFGLHVGAEHFLPLAHLQYWPYLVFLLAGVAAVMASLLLGTRWRVAALASLALVPAVIMDPAWGEPDAGSGRLRLMTFNAKDYETLDHPEGYLEIAAEIARHDPDLILMQDAGEIGTSDAALVKALFGERQLYAHGEYVVASRMPLRGCAPYDMSFGTHQRSYVRCFVSVDGVEVEIFNVHLESPRRGLTGIRREPVHAFDAWRESVEARLSESRAVASQLRRSSGAVVVAGDLNAPERSLVVRALLAPGLRDAFSSASRGYGYTYGHLLRPGLSFIRIDHILVSEEIGVRDCFVGPQGLSPHRAVVADLLVRPSR